MHKTYFQFLSSLFSIPMLIGKFSPHFLVFLPVKWTHQNEGTVIILLVEILKLILKMKFEICVRTLDMTSRSYFGKVNSTLGSVMPLAVFPKKNSDTIF